MKDYPKPPFPPQGQDHPGIENKLNPWPDYGRETYQGTGKLEGKVALITGGDSGIGRAVALAFAREGADITLSYLPEEKIDAKEIADLIRQAGRQVLEMPGDLADPDYCRSLVSKTVDTYSKVDIVVNNAAFSQDHPTILEVPFEEWEHTFKVNLFSMFHICKAAIPHMEPGSAIINVASVEAFNPDIKALAYGTTKGAIVTFTKSLGGEVIKKGIRCNVVCPGPFWTPLGTTSMSPHLVANYGHQTEMGRPGQPVEAAPLFVYLASDDSSFVANEVFVIAGGMPLP